MFTNRNQFNTAQFNSMSIEVIRGGSIANVEVTATGNGLIVFQGGSQSIVGVTAFGEGRLRGGIKLWLN